MEKISVKGSTGRPFILSILSGLVIGIAWPPLPFAPIVLIGFVPLIIVLEKSQNVKSTFIYSFITFFIWWAITMYWMGNVSAGSLDYLLIFVGFILAPLSMTIPVLVTFWLRRKTSNVYSWFSLCFFWTAYEYLLSNWDLAYNWTMLGLSFSLFPSFVQIYELIGTIGGSFVIIGLNILVFILIWKWQNKLTLKSTIISIIGILTFIMAINLLTINTSKKSKMKAKVAILQPNYDSYKILTNSSLDEQLNIIEQMTTSLSDEDIDLVLIPEGYLNGIENKRIIINKLDSSYAVKRLKLLSKKINAAILSGFIGYTVYPDKTRATESATPVGNELYADVYNAAMLVSPDNSTQFYAKSKLVPFMERVPFLSSFRPIEELHFSLNQTNRSYGRIDNQRTLHYKDLNIIPVICLETVFPNYVRQYANKGGNIIAIISNESWAGNTSGYLQNAYYSSLLAIQLNKSVVRSANSGVSLITDNNGNISSSTKWNERDIIIKEVQLNSSKSFYSKNGDYFGKISVAVSSILLLFVGIKLVREKLYKVKK